MAYEAIVEDRQPDLSAFSRRFNVVFCSDRISNDAIQIELECCSGASAEGLSTVYHLGSRLFVMILRIDVPLLVFMVIPIASCHFSQPQRDYRS